MREEVCRLPCYFSMSLVFRRKDLSPTFVADFHDALTRAGLPFRSGFWGYEDSALPEIIAWNQGKLEDDFRLGFTEHYAHGYRQVLFDCGGFSEVRGFWQNQCPGAEQFSFYIIVPEDDMLTDGWQLPFLVPRVRHWAAVAERLWNAFPPIRSIQTGLEASPPAADLDRGQAPQVLPFAILPAADERLLPPGRFSRNALERNGLLVLDETLLSAP